MTAELALLFSLSASFLTLYYIWWSLEFGFKRFTSPINALLNLIPFYALVHSFVKHFKEQGKSK